MNDSTETDAGSLKTERSTAAPAPGSGAPTQLLDASPAPSRSGGQAVVRFALRYAMVWVLVVLVVVAQSVYPTFLTGDNLRNMLSQNAAVAIIAVGMTLVIIGGGFDLSVGAIYGLGAVTFAKVSVEMSLPAATALVLVVGLAAGLVNGLVVTRLKVNAFVATLGTSSLFLGAALIYSDTQPVPVNPVGFDGPGTAVWLTLPVGGVLTVLVFLAGGFLLSRTSFGQNVRAVGGNDEAARLAGVSVGTVRTLTYVLTGACASFGGLLDTSKLGVGQADQGANLPLLAIAIVILGGTSLRGGEGAVWRTAIGVLILATLTNLFDSLAISTAVQAMVQGAVLIAAVTIDVFGRRAASAA
jgi:ribose transport system permease protein